MTLRRPNFYQVLSTGYHSESMGDAHMSQGPSLRLLSNQVSHLSLDFCPVYHLLTACTRMLLISNTILTWRWYPVLVLNSPQKT